MALVYLKSVKKPIEKPKKIENNKRLKNLLRLKSCISLKHLKIGKKIDCENVFLTFLGGIEKKKRSIFNFSKVVRAIHTKFYLFANLYSTKMKVLFVEKGISYKKMSKLEMGVAYPESPCIVIHCKLEVQ